MTEQRELRVDDADSRAAPARLRAAHDEGRLDFAEYDSRLAQAYSSVTYADLDRLFADLPARVPVPVAPSSVPTVRARRAEVEAAHAFAGLPLVLKILWINYAFVVAVNLVVWIPHGARTYLTFYCQRKQPRQLVLQDMVSDGFNVKIPHPRP